MQPQNSISEPNKLQISEIGCRLPVTDCFVLKKDSSSEDQACDQTLYKTNISRTQALIRIDKYRLIFEIGFGYFIDI